MIKNVNTTDLFINGLCKKAMFVPLRVLEKSRCCLLDYMGVYLGGKEYYKQNHIDLQDLFSDNTNSDFAFLNGFASHVLELDDGHRLGMIHLGSPIISALFAVAKSQKLSSDAIQHGIIMGYEAAVRCARAIQPGHKIRGYHVSGTCGTIGAAFGISFACNYNREQLKSTLACAVSSVAGLLEIQEQASELKPFNVGHAAMNGVVAAQIGKFAIPGPNDILCGKRGFLSAMTDTPHSEYLTDFSNEDYSIEGIYQKVYAACRHCHPAIDATLDMRRNLKFMPEQVEKIDVHTYKLAVESHNHIDIQGISSAKLSTPYSIALACVRGSAGFADYNEENLNDFWIKNITNKVHVIVDEELTRLSPEVRGARVTLYLKDGGKYESSCMFPKGEPENSLIQEELENKFRGLAMYGGLSPAECDEVIHEIWKDDFDLNKIMNIVCK